MRKERTNVYITPRQKQQLEKRSHEDDLSMAEIIRRAIDVYLAWDDPTYQKVEDKRNAHSAPSL